MEYKVTKQHWGDKQYFEGDTRKVKNDSDAKELLRMGLIIDPKAAAADKKQAAADAKAEKEAADKAKADEKAGDAEKAAPENKNKMAKEPANKSE